MPVERPSCLILGGTGEAAALAAALRQGWPDLRLVTSLAGRTAQPLPLPGEFRVGGFGGAEGLAEYMARERFTALVDCTHPFAARISAHARQACEALAVPRLTLARPDWERQPGDRWILAADAAEAARMLPGLGRRAFLTVGAGELAAFAGLPEVWLLARLLAPRAKPLPLAAHGLVFGRGPFTEEAERRLLAEHGIEVVVSKASGGGATYGKIAAARHLGLPVLMIRRPPPEPGNRVDGLAEAVAWLSGNLPRLFMQGCA